MTRPNRPDLGALPEMPPEEIAALPAEILALLQRDSDAALSAAKATRARLDAALELRYAERAAAARRAAGKDTGTVRLEDDGVTVVADLPKRIRWDQDILAALAERIRTAGEDPRDYLEITYKVPERRYAAWPPTIREDFAPARAVETGSLSIKLGEAR
jgi:hypothetical protein